jgi:hypothetical protein
MNRKVIYYAWAAAALFSAACFSSCSVASTTSRTPDEASALIEQLEGAKHTDLQNALAPDILPIAQGDLMISAGKATTAIEKLRRGEYISQTEVAQALVVPPKSLSVEERVYLIRQLEAAIAMDNQGFDDYPRDPGKEEDFQVQARMAEQVAHQLRNGETVSWWAIQQALEVPANP